jgi:hypothetical protein
LFTGRWRTMVRQNPASKGVIAKIVFLKGLRVKGERRSPGAGRGFFLTLYIKYTGLKLTKMPTLIPFDCWN